MFHGSMVALVTPFKSDNSIDFDALARLISWHINEGTHAICVAGTTGESAVLSHQEKCDLIRFTVDEVKDRVPVIAGTACQGTEDTIALTHDALSLGADAALIMTPAYIKPTQEGLFEHYRRIAESVALPIILYNVPSRTACDLLPKTIARLADISNIIGVKEATGDLNRVVEIRQRCGDKIDVYSGDDGSAISLMRLGAKGVISVTANIIPKIMAELCNTVLSGNGDQAEDKQFLLQDLHDAMFVEANPIPVKWALSKMGFISPSLRSPLLTLSSQHHERLQMVLTKHGLIK